MNIDAYSEIFSALDRELWLITARAGDRSSGLIATHVSNASLVSDLPRVMIGLANHHFTRELIEASGAFAMHLVDAADIELVWRFGIPSGRDVEKFQGLAITTGASGSPILASAHAWLDCRVQAKLDTGDRTVYVAEVLDSRIEHAATPLTFNRLLQLAQPEQLRELKLGMERDIEIDRAAILAWRLAKDSRDT